MSDASDPADAHALQWRHIEDAILRSSGALDSSMREALAGGLEIPQPLKLYVEKVTRYAYRVTDNDVRSLLAAGYSQDQIFEATLSIALGAAQTRLRAGLTALGAGAPHQTGKQGAEPAPDAAGRAMGDEE
jgi:hypothetical protein